MKWIIAILIFSLLIVFHEFGHFLLAKMNGVEVEEFSLGFGPRLLSTKRGATRYSIKALLFGGSCRMKGMAEYLDEEDDERKPPEEGSFYSVSVGRRAAIIFAGPLFNFILAFICAVIVISVVGYDPAEVLFVEEGSPAAEAGLQPGDVITSFMGSHVDIGRDVETWFIFHDLTKDTPLSLSWRRDQETYSAVIEPNVVLRYLLGITYNLDDERAVVQEVSENSPLAKAGVIPGDVIVSIDGTAVTTAKSMNEYFAEQPLSSRPVELLLLRGEEEIRATVTPVGREQVSLGFRYNLGREGTSAFGVLKYSAVELRYWIGTTVKSLSALFTGRFSVNDLSGPVGVVDIVGTTYEESKSEGPLMTWMNLINLIILLSANLGVMNLLPIPAIDGGRLLFLLIEAVRGKPVDKNIEAAVQTVAAILLIILMAYVMYHDVTRLF